MNVNIQENIWLDNESIKNAVCSILSISHQELDLILPIKSDDFEHVRDVFNQILNDGFSKQWRRTLCFHLSEKHLDTPNFNNATAQFTKMFNGQFIKLLASKNLQKRQIILKKFEEKIHKPISPLLVINKDYSHHYENDLYALALSIEKVFFQNFLAAEQLLLDEKKVTHTGRYSVELTCREIKLVSNYVNNDLLYKLKKKAMNNKNPDDIWTRLIMNSSLNRSIVEIDIFSALLNETSENIQNMLNILNIQELNRLNFNLEKHQFIDYLFDTVKALKGFNVDQDELIIQVDEFYKKYSEARIKPVGEDAFTIIHNSIQNRNLMILIFVWIQFNMPKMNNRVFGDTNASEKIVFNGKKINSVNIFYYLRRMYNTLYYATNIESKMFHFQIDRIINYQEAIYYKQMSFRNILIEMKKLPISSIEQLIKKSV